MRVFVLCSNHLLGEGLASLLKYSGGYDVVGRDVRFSEESVAEASPDVLLLTEDCSTADLERALASDPQSVEARIVVIGRETNVAGLADAVIEPSLGSSELFARLRSLPATRRRTSGNGSVPQHNGSLLSPREKDVARLVANGLSNRQIADQLGMQEQSVKNCVSSLMTKLGVGNRVQILLRVQESNGLLD